MRYTFLIGFIVLFFFNNILMSQTTHQLQEDLSLKYLVQLPANKTPNPRVLILMHGYGSNEADLFGLASGLPKDLLIISARAPNTIGKDMYAWFQVDFTGAKPEISEQQELQSRKLIKEFIGQIKHKYHTGELYLGGFSQGAIMSCSVALTEPGTIKGIIALSGRILTQYRSAVVQSAALKQLKVFVAHGVYDATLPIAYGREAKDYLTGLGVKLSYHEYPMKHEISMEELKDLVEWMK